MGERHVWWYHGRKILSVIGLVVLAAAIFAAEYGFALVNGDLSWGWQLVGAILLAFVIAVPVGALIGWLINLLARYGKIL